MVLRIDELAGAISARCPDYAGLLAGGVPPGEADRLLTERGALSETELMQLYAKATGVEPFDEETLETPARFAGIREEYLTG